MPPNEGNRIGVGVGYDDPGDSTLRYLREVNRAGRDLMRTFSELGQLRVEIPSIGGQQGQQHQGLVNPQFVHDQKARITEVANFQIAETHRVAQAASLIQRQSTEQLKRDAITYSQTSWGQGKAQAAEAELQRRSGSGSILGSNLSAEDRAILESARNPDPNRYYTGQHLGWPASKAKPGEGTPANLPTTHIPPIIEAESRGLTVEEQADEFRKRTIAQHEARKARQGIINDYEFQQRGSQTIGSLLGEKEVGRGEVDLEFEKRERRRVLNERINQRYEAQQAQQAQVEQQERTHAAEMQRRTHEAEQAATRAGHRTPEEQASFEQSNMRRYQTQYAGMRGARQRRVGQQDDERRRQAWIAEQARLAEETRIERERLASTQWERDLENRVSQQRQGREGARKRTDTRDTRAAYDELARGERPTLGPEVPDRVRISNAEAQKKAQGEIRAEVKQTQKTFDEFRVEAVKDLDGITQKSSTMASQFSTQSRRYHGQMQQDIRQTAGAFNTLFQRAETLRAEIAKPNQGRDMITAMRQELRQLQAEMEKTIQESQKLKISMAEQGQDQMGQNSPFRRGIFGLGAGGGFGTVTARLIEYGAISRGVQAFKDLTKASLESAEAQSQAENALAAASRQAGLLASENERIVQSIQGQAGASRTQALLTTAAAQRFSTTAGRPGETGQLSTIIGNIAASRGLGNDKIAELLDQAQHEQGRFAQEYLGSSPEQIYRRYAERHRPELESGYQERRTIQQDVSSLSDMEKRRALIDELERKQTQFAGAMNNRADTLAGKMERVHGAWDNMTSSMGRFLASSQSIVTILDWIAAKLGGIKGPDEQAGSGPGGLLTEADIRTRALGGVSTNLNASSALAGGLAREVTQGAGIGSFLLHLFGGGEGHITAGDIPVFGPLINAKRAQGEQNELELNQAQDQLRRQNQARFLQLQQAGRVIYKDSAGKEFTQTELDKLSHEERGRVLSNFNMGNAGTFRIEGEKEFGSRMQKAFDAQLKALHEMQAAEETFTYELGHRQAALAKLRGIEDSLQTNVAGQFGQGIGGDNALVRPMIAMETASKRVELQWGGFSKEVQDTFTQVEKGNALFEIQKGHLDNIVSAQHSISEAKRLELSATLELTGAEERRLKVNEAQAQAASHIPRLLAEADTLERGYSTPQGQRGAFLQTLQNIMRLPGAVAPTNFGISGQVTRYDPRTGQVTDLSGASLAPGTQIAGGVGPMGQGRPLMAYEQAMLRSRYIFPGGMPDAPQSQFQRRQEEIADRTLREFASQIPKEALYSNDPSMRQLRFMLAGANRREAGRLNANVQDEIARARVGDLAAQEAQGLVNQLPGLRTQSLAEGRRQGLTGEALRSYERNVSGMYRGQLLAITGQLGDKELTPELRTARINALREDAAARIRMDAEAQHVRQQTMVFIAQILAEIQAYRKNIGQQGATGYDVSVKVENDSQARIDEKNLKELSTGFAAQQANRQSRLDGINPYQGGLVGGGF